MIVVPDSSVIALFSTIGRFELLFELLSSTRVRIPKYVINELLHGRKSRKSDYRAFRSHLGRKGGMIRGDRDLFSIVTLEKKR